MKNVIGLGLFLLFLGTQANAAMIHDYDLTSSLNDILGGPSLTGNPANIGPTGYTFGAGTGGLTVSNAFSDPATYTIEMRFELNTDTSGQVWNDILNFHNSDHELYDECGSPCTLDLYPSAAGTTAIPSGQFVDLVFSRDGSTNTVSAWIDGSSEFLALDDSELRAVFSDTNNIARFFYDENGASENAPGTVSTIKIFDQAYTPDTLPDAGAVPEPASTFLMGAGLGAILLAVRRRASLGL